MDRVRGAHRPKPTHITQDQSGCFSRLRGFWASARKIAGSMSPTLGVGDANLLKSQVHQIDCSLQRSALVQNVTAALRAAISPRWLACSLIASANEPCRTKKTNAPMMIHHGFMPSNPLVPFRSYVCRLTLG